MEKEMFKCRKCGKLIESEEDLWLEDCPECGGSMDYAFKCELCGEYHCYSEEYNCEKVCEDCVEDEINVENALEYGSQEGETESVSINGFLAFYFSEDEINEILTEMLYKSHRVAEEADRYLDNSSNFVDFLKRKNNGK